MKMIPREKIEQICAQLGGEVAVYASVTDTGEVYTRNADLQMTAASTIKTPLLALLLWYAEQGKIDIDVKRCIAENNFATGSGILRSLSHDVEMNLFDIAVLMIVVSDNTATNEVIDAVGMETFNAAMAELGYPKTSIGRKLCYRHYPAGTPGENLTCAAELGRMMDLAVRGELLSPYVSRTLLQILAGQNLQKFTALIPAEGWKQPREPLPTPAEGSVLVASKGGTLSGSRGISHDCAAFFLPDGRSYTLTVLTHTNDMIAARTAMAEISLAMYEALR